MSGTLTRPNANLILARMRDDDWDDPWGTTISWAFAVCEVLHFELGVNVPDEMEFRPSPVQDTVDEESYPDSEVLEMVRSSTVATEDLEFAALCLHRMLGWLRAAGRDY